MNLKQTLDQFGLRDIPLATLALPFLILMILVMMILPLPPLLLDLLFTFNIAVSLVVLMVAVFTIKPLDFSSFPVILMITTIMRLSLNVASTRAILMHGHEGTGAAGKVIEAFGHVIIGGNFFVGIILFAILMVINFMVITKGAGRIAEVGARVALDAMPGKQMAIDADLNAGLIDEKEARKRRTEVSQEADFYGSMDGASKYVRGDAIAAILILFITMIGGFTYGVVAHDLSMADAANNYVLLSIGDALVASVPSLVISIAAGLIVSRVGDSEDIGGQLIKQMSVAPKALGIAAGCLAILGVVPGMPHFVFLLLAGLLGYGAWYLKQRTLRQQATPVKPEEPAAKPNEASWDDAAPVDVLGLELGYRLINLIEKGSETDLLGRIKGVRRKFAQEVGFLPPSVHVKDNLDLRPGSYRIMLKGVAVADAEAFPGMFLAINPGGATQALPGTPTSDPAFGLPAVWIEESLRELAHASGYTVVDASTVVATHLHHVMQTHASKLLGRQEVQQLIDHVNKYAPKLLEDVIGKTVPLAAFQKVLQNLLEEGVHIRDLRTIVETLAEHGARTQDPADLTAQVRASLAPAIVQTIYGRTQDLSVIAFEPGLERVVVQGLASEQGAGIEPGLADTLVKAAGNAANAQEERGHPACLLVPDRIRMPLARMLKRAAPRLRVLGHSEIPDSHSISVGYLIGGAA
jgi:flagellar biosynthesis protein FlhA